MSAARKPKIFLSRTTKGLGAIAEKVVIVLGELGFEVIHQPKFSMGWRKIRHMLMEKIRECDSVLCLVGPVYGAAPGQHVGELADPDTGRTEFSYTQIEYLIARRLRKPIITVLLTRGFPFTGFRQSKEDAGLQRDFVRDYIRKGEHLFYEYSSEAALLDALRTAEIEITNSLLPLATPQNIPFSTIGTIFTGRADTMDTIRRNLLCPPAASGQKKQSVQLIYGLGGVGKTRVAVEYAHAHADDYTARLFIRGSSPGALDESLSQLCGFFFLNLEEQDNTETDIRIQAVLRWLDAHPGYLLVIDNVDSDDARRAVNDILPRLQHGHVLITSRLHTWPGHILRLPLDVLSDTDGAALLLKFRASPKQPDANDECEAIALAHDLDGLALAIEQAAAFLNTSAYTIAKYHALWIRNSERVHEWHDPRTTDYPASVATTWLTSFDKLGSAAQAFLRLLSWLAPDPIPSDLLDSLSEGFLVAGPLEAADPRDALGRLIEFSLANSVPGNAFILHRLVQQITRERQPAPPDPPALVAALGWINGDFTGHSDDVRNWRVLVPLLPHAIAVASFAADRRIHDPSGRLLALAALLRHTQANYRAALPLYRRSLKLERACHGKNHASVASSLSSLGQLLVDTNRCSRAEPMMRRALAINEATFGAENPIVARDLNNLAQLLVKTKRMDEAELLMRRALSIDSASLGDVHPNVARNLNNLAQLLVETERLEEAEPMMERALRIDENYFGKEHPAVARDLNNLAQFYQMGSRLVEAESMMRLVLEIDTKCFGSDHPTVAADLDNLGQLLRATGRLAEAENLTRRALQILEDRFGRDHPNLVAELTSLASILRDAGMHGKVVPLLRRALKIDRRIHGSRHPRIADHLSSLAQMQMNTGKLKRAELLIREALKIDREILGPDDPIVASHLTVLARLLLVGNRLVEAEQLMRLSVEINERRLPADHPTVVADKKSLAQVLEITGQYEEAEPLLRQVLKIDIDRFGPDYPDVAADILRLVQLLRATSRSEEADLLTRETLTGDQQYDHPSDPWT